MLKQDFKNHIREELTRNIQGQSSATLEWKEKWFDDLASDYGNLYFANDEEGSNDLSEVSRFDYSIMINNLFDRVMMSKKDMLEQIANVQEPYDYIDLLIDNSDVENELKSKQDGAFETIIKGYLNGMVGKLYENMKILSDEEKSKMKEELVGKVTEFLQLSFEKKDVELLLAPVLDSLFNESSGEHLTSFLTIIPFLESGLRDCVLVQDFHNNMDKKKQESILNRLSTFSDILGSEDMLKIYGPNISFILRLCYGSQNTLNLRNISMHGYFCNDKFHMKHLWFLLLVMSNLASHISTQVSIAKTKVTNSKEQAQFDEMAKVRKLDGSKKYHEEYGISESSVSSLTVRPSLIEKLTQLDDIEKIAGKTFLIAHDRHEEWLKILKKYLSINEQDKLEMFELLSNLFPFFENLLRRLFIYSNLEPDLFKERCRMIKVERGRSLVVFDSILNNRPNDYYQITTNAIFEDFSEGLINCIYDLFKWPQGVRIRTLMAHGCVHWNWIPKSYLDRLILLTLYLMNQFSIEKIEHEILDEIYHFHLNYTPLFHPRKILSNEIEKTINCLEQIEHFYTTGEYIQMKDMAKLESVEEILEENTKHALLQKLGVINGNVVPLLSDGQYNLMKMSYIFKPIIQQIRYGVDEISEKEFKVLLLANRMTNEISSILNTQLNGLTSKWKKLSKLSSSQKSSFLNAINFTEIIHQVCEYCLAVQLGVLTCASKTESLVAGCDRFCSQFQASLPKSHLSKSVEIIIAFVLGSEDASQCGYTFANIKNKALLKSLYHLQQK